MYTYIVSVHVCTCLSWNFRLLGRSIMETGNTHFQLLSARNAHLRFVWRAAMSEQSTQHCCCLSCGELTGSREIANLFLCRLLPLNKAADYVATHQYVDC